MPDRARHHPSFCDLGDRCRGAAATVAVDFDGSHTRSGRWLAEQWMDGFEVTHGEPHARYYIDDHGFHFTS